MNEAKNDQVRPLVSKRRIGAGSVAYYVFLLIQLVLCEAKRLFIEGY